MKTRILVCLWFFVPLMAQVDEGWRHLAVTHDMEAARTAFESVVDEGDALAEIGWFLTHTGDGPTESMQDAALRVIARNPDSPAAEFVMKWMHDYRECLGSWTENFGRLLADAEITNPELKVIYANTLRALARQKEDVPDLGGLSRKAGFATSWRLSERFGDFPIPAFDRVWPPEDQDYWEESIPFETPTGVVVPPSAAHGSGVFYALTAFENPVKQDVLLRLFSYHNLRLWVDGKEVMVSLGLEKHGSRVHNILLPLKPGRHEVLLKTTQTRTANGQFSLLISADQPVGLTVTPTGLSHKLKPGKPAKKVQVGLAKALADRDEPLARFVKAFLASKNRDNETEHRILEALYEDYPNSQLVGGQLATVFLGLLDYLPQEDQLSRAFQILSELNRAETVFLNNRLSLGMLLIRAKQVKVALELIKDAVDRNPQFCDGIEALMMLSKRENLPDVRDQTIKLLEDMGPSHRWAQQTLLSEAERDEDLTRKRELLENLNTLMPWEGYAAELEQMDQNYLAAIEDLKKRAAIFPEQVYYPFAIGRLYAQLGDQNAQRQWLAKTLEIDPTNRHALLAMVNLDCFEGKREAAIQRLRNHLAIEPADAEFRQRLSHLEGRTAFEAFRNDTIAIIEEAKQRPATTGADSELLLDQLMVRLFPDGSQMRYTHLITRVLTKEGVDVESELQLPEDLEILELRTIKANGEVLYPADIREKSSISLTGVSVGDFIDEEHIEYLPPAYYDPDGLDAAMTFIFQNVDRIYHHSELVLIYPEDLDPEPVLLSRNMPIEPEITTKDGLRIVRWLTNDLPPIRTEPAMPPQSYLNATASFYYNTTWEEIRDYYQHAVRQRLDLSYRVEDQLKAWREEGLSRKALAEKVYREVADRTEPGQSFYQNINQVWETKKGNPTLLLASMYRELGYECEIALTRPEQLRHFVFDVPMPEFSYALLRLKLDGESVWLDPSRQKLPFGYIPFEYRGARALVLRGEGPVFVDIPEFDHESERIETDYVLRFDVDGKVEGVGSETFRGSFAPQLEKRYQAMNRPETKQLVEAGMNETYPGAEVTEVTLTEDLPLATFEVVTDFRHPGLGTFEKGKSLTLPFPLPRTPLLERYGTLPNRRTPVYIGSPSYNIAKIEIVLPEGYAWETQSANHKLSTRFGSYNLDILRKDDKSLIIERTYKIPTQFVEPADYADFLEFCKALVQNEGQVFKASFQKR